MSVRPHAWTAARVAVAVFCWLTALYAFVASSTFASLQFLQPRVFSWVGLFSDWHAAAGWVALALVTGVCRHDIRRGEAAPRVAIPLVLTCGVAAAWNTMHPVLASLDGGSRSILIGVLALVPTIGLAGLDHLAAWAFLRRQAGAIDETGIRAFEGRLFVVTLGAALFTTAIYAGFTSIALAGAFEPDLLTLGLATGLAWSLVDHLWMACATFLAIAAIGRLTQRRFSLQYAVLGAALSAAVAVAFSRLAGDALGMPGGLAVFAAGAWGVSVVGTWGGLRLRREAAGDAALGSALDVFFGLPRGGALTAAATLPILATAGLAYASTAAARLADWDFVVLKSGVLIVWVVAFGVVYRLRAAPMRAPGWAIALVCVVPLVAQQTLEAGADQKRVLARYEVYNASFRLTHALLHDVASTPSFDRFLRANTNVDEPVAPLDLEFVPAPAFAPPPQASKPLVFLFVIDSLRPDYLGSYNPDVRFTPRLDAFAAESVVFQNAFTRYGGTGMSVPAIWAGSALVHKQYVLPFHPMNTLEKLLDRSGYRRLLGLDSIMQRLLVRSPGLEELDAGVTTMDYRLCGTLEQIESALGSTDPSVPVFAYSLPQDVHMSRLPATVETGPDFRGFHAPYATKVHAIDACFGRFVDGLKRRNLYDQSLIVVTADHGEMLGEDGRFGHSHHLFPPVIRVPLIVHLPAALARRAAIDADAVSLTTDITPTIYSALGYHPQRANPLMGRSLVDSDGDASAERRREPVVIASSYGPVYAALQHNGRRLYIANGLNGGDTAYARDASGRWTEIEVSRGLRTVGQFLIRQYVDGVRRTFRMPGQADGRPVVP